MDQFNLFSSSDIEAKPAIESISHARHYSVFRYPGGKSWAVPFIKRWLQKLGRPKKFIEPFAGGAVVGLSVALENLADHVILIEKDPNVAAVWEIICNGSDGDIKSLCSKLENFTPSRELVIELLAKNETDTLNRAFKTILKNRFSDGGILTDDAGILKNGENNKGLTSRWYPKTLIKRINLIRHFREKISFIEGCAFKTLDEFKNDKNAVFFIDPPYTAGGKNAGTRLYPFFEIDHKSLFEKMSEIEGSFLATYDVSENVKEMANHFRFNVVETNMRNTKNLMQSELFIMQ